MISAGHDSTSWKLKVINQYSVVIGLKKGMLFAEVTNKEPYTETTGLRSYELTSPRPKRVEIGLQAECGVGNNGLDLYVGIWLNYSLIHVR